MGDANVVDVEYLIIGAGMAGTVLEHFLRSDNKVLLDPNPAGYKIGESIAPELFHHPELKSLLKDVHELPSFTHKWGATFSSEDSVASFPLSTDDFKRSMHVSRSELEALMHERWGTKITRERVVEVDVARHVVRTDAKTYRVAKQILDCSGPSMVVARALGTVHEQWPVFARWGYLDIVETDNDAFFTDIKARGAKFSTYDAVSDRHVYGPVPEGWAPSRTTLLHQVRTGVWLWQIPLFHGTRLSVGVVSRTGRVSEEEFWKVVDEHVNPMYKVKRRPAGRETPYDRLHVRDHFAVVAQPAATEDYVLVADALGFSDPIYSVGAALAGNKAVELADLLNDGGWSAEKAAQWNDENEALYRQANEAFDAWYSGRALNDHSISGEILDRFLVGTAFQVGIATHYSRSIINSMANHAGEEHGVLLMSERPHVPAAKLQEMLSAFELQPMLAGWDIVGGHPVRGGVQLRFLAVGLPELVVNLTDVSKTTAYYRVTQGLAMSFMNLPHAPYPLGDEAKRVFDALVAAVDADPKAWRELAGLDSA